MTANGRVVHHAGRFVPEAEATLPVGSLALRYGLSVFEGVRLYVHDDGRLVPWLLDEHLRRLAGSVDLMQLGSGADLLADAKVPEVVDELVERNRLAVDAYCRIAVSAGGSGLMDAAVDPVVTVSVSPSDRKRWLRDGVAMRAHLGEWERPGGHALPPAAKCIAAYAGPRLALLEAKRLGYDVALLRSPTGTVAEAPTATLFAVVDGVVRTPPISDGVLPGVTRSWVLAAARELGLRCEVGPVTEDELHRAAEVFLCGTGIEFGPVGEVDGTTYDAAPGPVTAALVDRYFAEARGRAEPVAVDWTPGD